MSIEDWQEELFSLYRKCRAHPSFPKNYHELFSWMDEDALVFLRKVHELHEKGALTLVREK